MALETVHPLDSETLKLFALKGTQGESEVPQSGNANAVKVRRVLQIASDLARVPFEQLRILDLACGEGVYSIEAALRGAEVVAVDGRTERMQEGESAANRLGLSKLKFQQHDVRAVTQQTHGEFDAVCFLGILYHLDAKDIFPVIANIQKMCRHMLIIDTHIALQKQDTFEHEGHVYEGMKVREHNDDDSEEVRKSRVLMSLDNTWSFWFTPSSLVRMLVDSGFTSVFSCEAPLEHGKPENRVTLAAIKGDPVRISTYPWINDKSEAELEASLSANGHAVVRQREPEQPGLKQRAKRVINTMLRPTGFELRRINQ